jgi:hypothetical protein
LKCEYTKKVWNIAFVKLGRQVAVLQDRKEMFQLWSKKGPRHILEQASSEKGLDGNSYIFELEDLVG